MSWFWFEHVFLVVFQVLMLVGLWAATRSLVSCYAPPKAHKRRRVAAQNPIWLEETDLFRWPKTCAYKRLEVKHDFER